VRRREFIAGIGAAAWPLVARAREGERVRRVGMLAGGAENDPGWSGNRDAFWEGLAKLGWIDGRNLRVDLRFAADDTDRMRTYAAELTRLAPDVIVTVSNAATRAAQQQTKTIPIVYAAGGDPALVGLVRNLARPEGNITGFVAYEASIASKWLELLKDAAPHLTTVAILYDPQIGMMAPGYIAAIEAAAAALSIGIVKAPAHDPAEIMRAVDAFGSTPNGGLVVLQPPRTAVLDAISPLALRYRMPAIYQGLAATAAGGLVSYGNDTSDNFRRAAGYVDRLLRGAKVSELPVQFPTKYKLIINAKTAKAIGLTIPESFLLRADEVIE